MRGTVSYGKFRMGYLGRTRWNGCVCDCEGTGDRSGECLSGTWVRDLIDLHTGLKGFRGFLN